MRAAYVAAAVGVVAVAWWYLEEEGGGELVEVVEGAAQTLDEWTGGVMKLSEMAKVTNQHVSHPNVRAFLRVIRTGEGTADEKGYSRIFGGEQFTSYVDHPRKLVIKGAYRSTAAGAYQALESTWDETRKIMKLNNFNPIAQDYFAVGRIAARGALADVIAGRFEVAVKKCAKEWASLPGSPYGQPTISLGRALTVYAQAGGQVTAEAVA